MMIFPLLLHQISNFCVVMQFSCTAISVECFTHMHVVLIEGSPDTGPTSNRLTCQDPDLIYLQATGLYM